MLAELVYDRADLTLFPLTILESRTEVIDFTYSYVDGGIGLLVSAAKQSSSTLGFLRPFSWEARPSGVQRCFGGGAPCAQRPLCAQVWIALLATVLGVVVLMHILARLTPLGNFDLKAVRLASASSQPPQEYIIDPGALPPVTPRSSSLAGAQAERARVRAGNSLWVAVLWCCVNSPFLPRGRSWSVRILQLAFGFFCVVIVNTYTASLASLLTVQNLSTPITSLLDLLRACARGLAPAAWRSNSRRPQRGGGVQRRPFRGQPQRVDLQLLHVHPRPCGPGSGAQDAAAGQL